MGGSYGNYNNYLISIYNSDNYYLTKYYYVTAFKESDALKYLKNYLKDEVYKVREEQINDIVPLNSIEEYDDALKNIVGKVELSVW